MDIGLYVVPYQSPCTGSMSFGITSNVDGSSRWPAHGEAGRSAYQRWLLAMLVRPNAKHRAMTYCTASQEVASIIAEFFMGQLRLHSNMACCTVAGETGS